MRLSSARVSCHVGLAIRVSDLPSINRLESWIIYLVGAPLAGRISDKIVVKWRERRGGVWYPEDRLRAAIHSALFLVPLSVLCSGLLTQFVDGNIGLFLNLVCLFVNGMGVSMHIRSHIFLWCFAIFAYRLILYSVHRLHTQSILCTTAALKL
jgi:hypothetical protein